MPRLARSSARLGPTPLIMRTSVVRERDIDALFIPLGERWPRKSQPRAIDARLHGWLTIIPPHPLFFRMCGKQRTCRRAILYVWQGKGLRADFAYVWQGKELVPSESRIWTICVGAEWCEIAGQRTLARASETSAGFAICGLVGGFLVLRALKWRDQGTATVLVH